MNPVRANLSQCPEEYPFSGSLTNIWQKTRQPAAADQQDLPSFLRNRTDNHQLKMFRGLFRNKELMTNNCQLSRGEGTGARGATGPQGRMSNAEARSLCLAGVTRISRACEYFVTRQSCFCIRARLQPCQTWRGINRL
jgi:hypothetical protein